MIYQFFKNNDSLKKESQKNKKQEGRSMVEMLGVLAIIGVLSIGGIQGYTIAMRRYKANEIVNAMNKFATVVYTGFQNRKMNDPASVRVYNHGWYIHYPVYTCSEKNDYSSCITIQNYTDSGLGSLPIGVLDFKANSIVSKIDENGVSSLEQYVESPNPLHSDYIGIIIHFSNNDKELCKTVKEMLDIHPIYSYEGEKGCNADSWGENAYISKMIPVD